MNTQERRFALEKVFDAKTDKHDQVINDFENSFNTLELGGLTEAVIKDVINNNTVNIEAKLKASVENQITDLKITSPLLQSAIFKGVKLILEDFNRAVDSLVVSANKALKIDAFEKTTAKQMKIKFLAIGGHGDSIKNIQEKFKSLEVGGKASFTTNCGKTFGLIHSKINITASETTEYFIYAKLARGQNNATLVVFNEPQANNETDLLIYWRSGKFEDINF